MSTVAVVLLMCLSLMLKTLFLSYSLISLSPFYFPSNVYLNLLLSYITIQYFQEDISLLSTFSILLYLIPCLKSSINSFLSYLLPLTVLLNFCTNFSIVLLFYSTFLISATFNISLSPLPSSCFKFVRNSSTVACAKLSFSKSSIIFSFYISANSLYTYDKTYYTYFSTTTSLIFIYIYNLYTV